VFGDGDSDVNDVDIVIDVDVDVDVDVDIDVDVSSGGGDVWCGAGIVLVPMFIEIVLVGFMDSTSRRGFDGMSRQGRRTSRGHNLRGKGSHETESMILQ
jgi:hypothetical protein